MSPRLMLRHARNGQRRLTLSHAFYGQRRRVSGCLRSTWLNLLNLTLKPQGNLRTHYWPRLAPDRPQRVRGNLGRSKGSSFSTEELCFKGNGGRANRRSRRLLEGAHCILTLTTVGNVRSHDVVPDHMLTSRTAGSAAGLTDVTCICCT